MPSYRDSELIPTIESMAATCSDPKRLRIVICNQGDEADFAPVEAYKASSDLDILHIQVDAKDASGAGWARAKIQSYYQDEGHYLQLDSHIQFRKGWDVILDTDLHAAEAMCGKAVLTAYLPGYKLSVGSRSFKSETATIFSLNTHNGFVGAIAKHMPPSHLPRRCYFYSGHFSYARGQFVKDVPYDPEIFFFGEEISHAIRSESAGYALFCPGQFVAAHLYARSEIHQRKRRLVWDDAEDNARDLRWWNRDKMSKHKVRAICYGEWFGEYGIQDLDKYERYRDVLMNLYGIDLKAV
ncbi:MAG: GlcNAc-transferase family protein [Pseudomonadota bacterium]